MTYEQTLDFLFSQLPAFHRIGKAAYRSDLNNTLLLDDYFNNPHKNYPTIHIGGTNGKGSVSHMVASIFQEAGYKTGLYTSPHLRDFRERIKVNGEMIPKEKVTSFINDHKNIIDNVRPSFFELSVAMAFNYFAEIKIDVAVVEVGLGGRLDSTNIINPVLSVITNIGHDHMDLLGNTLEKIAVEKSGIIKRNAPVVISETQAEIREIFLEKALESGSAIVFADKMFSCRLGENDFLTNLRKFWITDLSTNRITSGEISLGGDYQARNLQGVFATAFLLRNRFQLSDINILDGIKKVVENTGLLGRWQILGTSPLTICDTGHNREGLGYVMQQIKLIPKSGLHIIVGFVNDKDLGLVLPLFPGDAQYYFTKASVPRALDEEILRIQAAGYGLKGQSFPDVSGALQSARKNAKESDLIFIGGSTFVVAEII